MSTQWRWVSASLALLAGMGLAGCSSLLKPSGIESRYFVLSPLAGESAPRAGSGPNLGLGVVKMPDYLLDPTLICRRGTNEIVRIADARWAERLDLGFQRVLAANLGTLLPGSEVRVSAWRPAEVRWEIYATVTQFDTDESGRSVLVAEWRIQGPNSSGILRSGRFAADRRGAAPGQDPARAVATLDALVGDFSREIAAGVNSIPR